MALFFVAVVVSVAFAQFPCNDDDSWTFGRYKWKNPATGKMETTIRTCSWLISNPNYSSKRLRKWCDYENQNGVVVKDKCKVACGQCDPRLPIPDPEECKNQPFNWRDLDGNDCDFYAQGDNCNTVFGRDRKGISAEEACCACNGGCFDVRVEVTEDDGTVNIIPWYDATGSSCEWFENDPNYRCQFWGGSYRNFGYFPDNACCVCGGGSTSRSTMSN